jgi:hypothetical protein
MRIDQGKKTITSQKSLVKMFNQMTSTNEDEGVMALAFTWQKERTTHSYQSVDGR